MDQSRSAVPATIDPLSGAVPEAGIRKARFPDGLIWGAATATYPVEGAGTRTARASRSGPVRPYHRQGARRRHRRRRLRPVSPLRGGRGADAPAQPPELPLFHLLTAHPADRHQRAQIKGLDYYSRLVDALLAADIRPWYTLYHWDLPQALEDRGGWPNRDLADHAGIPAKHFGDRITRLGAVQHALDDRLHGLCRRRLPALPHQPPRLPKGCAISQALPKAALGDAADVRAFHARTLFDNFLWAEGHTKRYGLIHTDFRTRKRTIKDSGLRYGRVAATNRLDW